MSNQIKVPEIPQALNQYIKQMEPFLNSIEPAMIRLAKQMEPMTEGLKHLNDVFEKIDVEKLNSKLETLFKRTEPFIEGLKQVSAFLERVDFEELQFNMDRLQKCSPYLNDLRADITLKDILIAIEGVPESEYEEVLIRKLGKSSARRRLSKRAALKAKQKLLLTWGILNAILTVISVCELPLPKTIPEALQVLLRYPEQTVQCAHENTPVPQSIYQNVAIVRTGKRKNRSHKRRGNQKCSFKAHSHDSTLQGFKLKKSTEQRLKSACIERLKGEVREDV